MTVNEQNADNISVKLANLREYIKSLGRVLIAFSGGTDSTLLLKIASEELGQNVAAITAKSCFVPAVDIAETENFCKEYGIKHKIMEFDPLKFPEIVKNTPERCYFCKKRIFSTFLNFAGKNNIYAVCEGSNEDDISDYRPGMRAIRELGIKSPFLECSLYKAEIRQILRNFGLPSWNKPSAACLASRISYNEAITEEKLSMAEGGESFLHGLGLSQLRVRVHSGLNYAEKDGICGKMNNLIARIEVLPDEMNILFENRKEIYAKFKEIGFSYVAMDLLGYRTGSLNEILRK